ncbi:hypothetical protein IU450_28695 [Nocardia abscessus]|uniref:hypothetical protein n=1 Tax=Nocardia abscessus TaxID=120957 RepID=UPI001895D946|nr:hypothetical protein [Nocardia abscessus]MBF6339840.1 hypothetical protein [Nocardia abscessus]
MTTDQQALVRAVVDAINTATREVTAVELAGYLAGRIAPAPSPEDVAAVMRILALPAVAFRRGEPGTIVLARILDVMEAAAGGEDYSPPSAETDSRY